MVIWPNSLALAQKVWCMHNSYIRLFALEHARAHTHTHARTHTHTQIKSIKLTNVQLQKIYVLLINVAGINTLSYATVNGWNKVRKTSKKTSNLTVNTEIIITNNFPINNTPSKIYPPTKLRYTVTAVYIIKNTHQFNGHLSWTTRVSRYQKGKTNLDFTEARDSEWQWNQLGLHHAPDR